MTGTLLVTTDFSANSKGAIRFAIQWAQQTKQRLAFFCCLPYLRPTRWTEAQFKAYSEGEKQKAEAALDRFVRDVYRTAGIKKPKFKCIVAMKDDVSRAIVGTAREIEATAICMGTRGAGKLRKLIGTNSSAMVNKSPLPLFVVPANYRRAKIKRVVYGSDLEYIGKELKQVRSIAKRLDAKVTVLHYDYLADVDVARKKLEKIAAKYKSQDVKFHFKKYHIDKSLAFHLLRDIKSAKASLAILYTNRRRGWFDRLFLSSKSADVAQAAKLPLLIIPRD